MHLIGSKAHIVREYPWVMDELSELIDASQRMWLKNARNTPIRRLRCPLHLVYDGGINLTNEADWIGLC